MIDRRFVRLGAGLVHLRTAEPATGASALPPVYLAHSGPGSSKGLLSLLTTLGAGRQVIAPDMMGNGDSDPPPGAAPDLAFYVDCAVRLLDALGIDQVDFYGTHSGAHIGCELAIAHPTRVRRLVLDGLAVFPAALRNEMIERYAPAVVPDEFGGHLAWAWQFVDGLTLHFPYYRRDPAHRLLGSAVPPAAARQALVTDLIKALPTYHLAYQAVFRHPTAERLPLVGQPTLLMGVEGDPLAAYLADAAALLPTALQALVPRADRDRRVLAFLDT